MFATGSLARRIERAEVTLVADGAAGAIQRLSPEDVMIVSLAGGVAAFIEPGSPFNKIAGLGFDGLPDEEQLGAFESAVARRGAPIQVELASLGLPDVARLFTRRGVHTAMLDRRLLDAAEQGCDVAVMTTEPGSKSQQNAQRFGFSVLYVRAVLVKSASPL